MNRYRFGTAITRCFKLWRALNAGKSSVEEKVQARVAAGSTKEAGSSGCLTALITNTQPTTTTASQISESRK